MVGGQVANKFKKVEKILNINSDIVEQTIVQPTNDFYDTIPDIVLKDVQCDKNIVLRDELYETFCAIKLHLKQLIGYGQKMMQNASKLDIQTLKASEVASIAQLSDSVGHQITNMVDIYDKIATLDNKLMQESKQPSDRQTASAVNGTVFCGTNSELLEYISQK